MWQPKRSSLYTRPKSALSICVCVCAHLAASPERTRKHLDQGRQVTNLVQSHRRA